MTDNRHPDPVAQAEELPKELRLYGWGGWFMGVGTAVTVCLWSVNAAEELPHTIYAPAVTASIVAVIVGCLFSVILNVALWVVKEICRHQDAAANRSTAAMATVDRHLMALAGPLANLAAQVQATAAQVQANTTNIAQLAAQKTVDLDELRRELDESVEAAARVAKAEAVDEVSKRFDKRFDDLDHRLDTIAPDMHGAQYLADMARSVELGREMERRKPDTN